MDDSGRTTEDLHFQLCQMRSRMAALEHLEAEREHALEALRESEERYRSFLRNFHGIAFRCTLDWRPILFHGAVERITGRGEEDFIRGQITWEAIVHPDDLHFTQDRPADLWTVPGHNHEMDYRILHSDGSVRWVREHITNICGPEGKPVWLEGLMLDITSRREAEDALRQSQKDWKDTFDAIPDWIAVIDASGRILRSNGRSRRFVGLAPHQAEGQVCCTLVHGVKAPLPGCPLARVVHSRVRETAEVQLTSSGRWLAVTVDPVLDHQGNVQRAVHIVSDITEQKLATAEQRKIEERLRQSQKMEVVGRLAGGVAHDFNNLLTVISGNTQIVLTSIEEQAPGSAEAKAALQDIERAAEHGAALTRQLLSFSRKQVPHPQLLKPNDVITGIQPMLRRLIGEHIDIQLNLEPGVDSVQLDPGQFEQILMNLALNARDAMPQGGTLSIQTRAANVDSVCAAEHLDGQLGAHIAVSITDTGQGMDPQTLAHAFEPFFTTKPADKGTGLGLATVYGIVKQAGGHIAVSSSPGYGTTFTVHLPAVKGVSATTARVKNLASMTGEGTILVCEDDEMMRYLLRIVLAKAGYTILEASSGREALELASATAETVDLLITDLVMPEMNGRRLAAELRRHHRDLDVIIISGYSAEVLDASTLAAEKLDFMAKPFQLAQLLGRVHEVMAHHRKRLSG